MRYRNKITGAVINVSSKLGGPWVPVDDGTQTAQVEEQEKQSVRKKNSRKKE